MYTIELPIKTHLKKYLAHYADVDPYVITRKEGFSRIIYHELSYPLAAISSAENLDDLFKFYGSKITLKVNKNIYEHFKSRSNLTIKSVISINSYVRSLFMFQFHFYMDTVLTIDKSVNQRLAAIRFMEQYDIDCNDIDRDSMLRDYRRYKKRNKKNIFAKKRIKI